MQIDHDDLTKGAKVWFGYRNIKVTGPWTISAITRGQEGRVAFLIKPGDERRVILADDEDYGVPLFYDCAP